MGLETQKQLEIEPSSACHADRGACRSPLSMPPHLHPRSRSTTSLFTATLLASFLIVGMPHVFPCPAPRRTLADSGMTTTPEDQQRIRKRRRKQTEQSTDLVTKPSPERTRELNDVTEEFRRMEEEAKRLTKMGRECPVPKPRGLIGQILGFNGSKESGAKDGLSRGDTPARESDH
ncbi:hypothetical protein PRK78_006466 [Emydomyces testavorans]|uniref:Uncharacterized protein n=1 Tax=Emydomyces testavorans TaxID=2070801 RepID=A0AAF0DLT5_9EURO|nr:hypothetical protein PRK78_006466 [Emydomyces testavorans]